MSGINSKLWNWWK